MFMNSNFVLYSGIELSSLIQFFFSIICEAWHWDEHHDIQKKPILSDYIFPPFIWLSFQLLPRGWCGYIWIPIVKCFLKIFHHWLIINWHGVGFFFLGKICCIVYSKSCKIYCGSGILPEDRLDHCASGLYPFMGLLC